MSNSFWSRWVHHGHLRSFRKVSLWVVFLCAVLFWLPFLSLRGFLALTVPFVVAGALGSMLPVWRFSKSFRIADRGVTTEFAPPAGVEPWEAAALLGTSDVVAEWFHEMLSAGALTWETVERVSDSTGDYSVVLLEVGDLSQVASVDAELIFNVVVPYGRPRLVKMEMSRVFHEDYCGSGTRRTVPAISFDASAGFSVTFNILRGHLQERLLATGWFTRFAFRPISRSHKKVPALHSKQRSFLVSRLFLFAVVYPIIYFTFLSALPGIVQAATLASCSALFAFFFFYTMSLPVERKSMQLSAEGSSIYQQVASFRRLLQTEIGDRAVDAKETGFGHEFFPWLRAFGMADVWDETVAYRGHTPLRLASEGSVVGKHYSPPSFPEVYPTVVLHPVPSEFLLPPQLSPEDEARGFLRRENLSGAVPKPMSEDLKSAALSVPTRQVDVNRPVVAPFRRSRPAIAAGLVAIGSLMGLQDTENPLFLLPAAAAFFALVKFYQRYNRRPDVIAAEAWKDDNRKLERDQWRSHARQHPGFQGTDFGGSDSPEVEGYDIPERKEVSDAPVSAGGLLGSVVQAFSTSGPGSKEFQNPAGWRKDPSQRFIYRYWDGWRWTDQVSNGGVLEVDPQGTKKLR